METLCRDKKTFFAINRGGKTTGETRKKGLKREKEK